MSDYPCTARNLAHYVVDKCAVAGDPVSNLQLQKILYFLQFVFCKKTGRLLFGEQFSAWPYGPVIERIYNEYRIYGGSKINRTYPSASDSIPRQIQPFVDNGIEYLSHRSPWDLVASSHAEGSPWARVWNEGNGYKNVISNQLIMTAARRKGSLKGRRARAVSV